MTYRSYKSYEPRGNGGNSGRGSGVGKSTTQNVKRETLKSLVALSAAAAGVALVLRLLWTALGRVNYRPKPIVALPIQHLTQAPDLPRNRRLKVLTYNVQFFAGTKYRFFYDGGPDTQVQPEDIFRTIERISQLICTEDPDIVLLQEVDRGVRRTGFIDELSVLQKSLANRYTEMVSAYYWRSAFVPHPKVWGPAGMQLAILSGYRMGQGRRYQLPLKPGNFFVRDFALKRALLEAELFSEQRLFVLNTHLEAWPGHTDIMSRQVESILARLVALDRAGFSWILGGDFNLAPRESSDSRLNDAAVDAPAELTRIFSRYKGFPSLADILSPDRARYFTFTTPAPGGRHPAKTLDYLFWSSRIRLISSEVIQERALALSDHLPVIGEFELG